MELTDNQDMVIPIMAACLLARAAASLFCPTPVYRDFAERMVQDFERQQASQRQSQDVVYELADDSLDETGDAAPAAVRTTAFDEPATPADPPPPAQP
jgi:hypothetical protein